MHATHPAVGVARIGPNAIIQTVAALKEEQGSEEVQRFLVRIGRDDLAAALPTTMVDEQEFINLIAALRAELGLATTRRVLARSGALTAEYVRTNRIPAPARILLPLLPRRLALRILLKAIVGHAWTFAGAGRFSYTLDRRGATLSLGSCPECRGITADEPICDYYVACFQGLLRPLIDPQLTVHERACTAQGAAACRFEVVLA